MNDSYFIRITEQLIISILGGIISGLVVTWIIKQELKKLFPKEAVKRIFTKENFIIIGLIVIVLVYGMLIKKGILPVPEFKDYMTVYDNEGNEYLYDGKEKIPTGQKRILPNQWIIQYEVPSNSAKDLVGGIIVEPTPNKK